MARTEVDRSVQPSLLDRLTDTEPSRPADAPGSRDQSERAFRRSVQRDVEWLLNTRRGIRRATASQPLTHQSVLEYGLLDTTGMSMSGEAGPSKLAEHIKDTLQRYEPRLTNVVVKLLGADEKQRLQVRFTIQATLLMDPTPEQIVFDTVLEMASGAYEVDAAD